MPNTNDVYQDGKLVSSTPVVLSAQAANELILNDIARAQLALTVNDAYLALATPSNAQIATQVQRLTREVNAMLRDRFGLYDDSSDT